MEFEVKVLEIKIEDQRPKREWSICSHLVSLNGASQLVVAEDGLKNIVAFNLATEKFQVFTMPLQNPRVYWEPLMFSKNRIWIVSILLGMTEKIKYTRWLKFASFPSHFRPQLVSRSLLLLDSDNVIDTTQKNSR
ncbi:hypothetical protein CFP56_039852 [Quercus suber]|uniref:Uncharacterized protein n=1 Tax=Quercus suber TaxID=58331 RepID=A0AAW0LKM4_QUESU